MPTSAKNLPPASLLSLENIETCYGPITAVRGIMLKVAQGKIVTLLGANGAGKTSILKTISGVLHPRSGRIAFKGQSILKHSPDQVARLGISHVPEGREIFPFLSVHENLMMGAYFRKDTENIASDLEIVYEYFPILKERLKQQGAYLSGGQQQMLALGRALMARPSLMLLDEPSLGLSPLLVQELFDIIARLNQEQGVTILLVEQNARMALSVGDYGYVLENGRVVMEDICSTLLKHKDIQECYLGMKDKNSRDKRRWKKRKTWR